MLRTVDPAEIKTVTTGVSVVFSEMLVAQDKSLLKEMLCTSSFGKEIKICFLVDKEALRGRCEGGIRGRGLIRPTKMITLGREEPEEQSNVDREMGVVGHSLVRSLLIKTE